MGVGLASPATKPSEGKKPTSRETLKKPPGLIFKKYSLRRERGEGEKMKEKMREGEVWGGKRMWS